MYRKILVGYDGSEGAKIALQEALILARAFKSQVVALWSQSTLPYYPETVGEIEDEKKAATAFFNKIAHYAKEIGRKQGIAVRCEFRTGHSAQILVKFAKTENCDLIIMGHSGHSRWRGRILGHTADRVSEHAHCSVLIVRPNGKAAGKYKKSEF